MQTKAQMKAWEQTPKRKAWKKAYEARYRQRDDRKAYLREYHKRYNQTEKAKSAARKRMRVRRLDKSYRMAEKIRNGVYRKTERCKQKAREWVEKNRLKRRKDWRKYLQTMHGRSKHRLIQAKRRAVKKGAGKAKLTHAQWQIVLEKYDHCCAYCGKAGVQLQIDHYFPLSKRGQHVQENVVPACWTCNSSKRDKHPHRLF